MSDDTNAQGSWKTSSTLLDDFTLEIEEAFFDKDKEYDRVTLNLRGPALQDGEVVDEEHLLKYSLGDGWEPKKNGEIATHKAGKDTFTNASSMGKLIDSIVGLGKEVIEELQTRGETYEAETWRNLRLHFVRKEYSFKDRESGEERTYEVPLATEYLGTLDEDSPEKKAPAKKATPKSRAKKAPAKEAAKAPAKGRGRAKKATAEVDLKAAVMEFAANYEDHAEFLSDVFDPELFEHAELLRADEELSVDVMDEEGEIWVDSAPDEE